MKRCVQAISCGLCGLLVLTCWSGALRADDRPTSRPATAATKPAATFLSADRRKWWERFPPPVVTRIAIPDFPGAHAIWGATGQDSRGHIWFGASATGVEIPSAHLFEFVPATGEVIDRGDVVSQLKRCGVYRDGEGQMKIHSKIVQADDGHLYFASMDEQDEDLRTEKLPTWGGHLWRLRLPENTWEHLLTTPEPLMAVAGAGGRVYALGYFGHKLYQYDCKSGRIRSVRVGAIRAHTSRNFFADGRGHVYVPRVKPGGRRGSATLVEFDAELREIAQSPLEQYLRWSPTHTHGIIGFQPLADGTIAFLTHNGYLYLLQPPADGSDRPAGVKGLGWFHPQGSCYTPSLFTDPANRYLMGVTEQHGRFDWVIYSLAHRSALAVAFSLRGPEPLWHRRTLLYGSVAHDQAGNFYIGGRTPRKSEGFEPILLQVRPRS